MGDRRNMITVKNPRKITLGNGMLYGVKVPDQQIEAIIYRTLLKYGIICDEIKVINEK